MAAFLLPLLLHIAWIGALYVWLTVARWQSARDGVARRKPGVSQGDMVARNLANQFELSPLVWFCALALIQFDAVGQVDIAAAWIFFVGRVIHSWVHIVVRNVPLRGGVFLINFAGAAMLALHLAIVVLGGLTE